MQLMALRATSESSVTASPGQMCRSTRLRQQQQYQLVACDDSCRQHEARRLLAAVPTSSNVCVAEATNDSCVPLVSDLAYATFSHRPEAVQTNGCYGVFGQKPLDAEQSEYNCRRRPSTIVYHHQRLSVAPECSSATSNWNRLPAAVLHSDSQNEFSGGKVPVIKRRMSAEGDNLHHNVHCELLQHQQDASCRGISSGPPDGCIRDNDRFRIMVMAMQSSDGPVMSHRSSPPVPPHHRRLSGVSTSASGWRPKLSRAVSEFSLYSRRLADARYLGDDERTCCGDGSWRNATDDESPPRIAPISGKLSKVSSFGYCKQRNGLTEMDVIETDQNGKNCRYEVLFSKFRPKCESHGLKWLIAIYRPYRPIATIQGAALNADLDQFRLIIAAALK